MRDAASLASNSFYYSLLEPHQSVGHATIEVTVVVVVAAAAAAAADQPRTSDSCFSFFFLRRSRAVDVVDLDGADDDVFECFD